MVNPDLVLIPGRPCNEQSEYLPPHTPPPPPTGLAEAELHNTWSPFDSRIEFDFAHYHFVEVLNLAGKINKALELWAASVMEYGRDAPWKDASELYATIDAIQEGDSPWKVYKIHYQGPRPPGTPLKWMMETYELCTWNSCQVLHHQLATVVFKDKINIAPYCQVNSKGVHTWSNCYESVRNYGIK